MSEACTQQHLTAKLLCRLCLLRVQIGSVNNSFGVPGVHEHCHYLKSLEDAHNLRTRVTECFERAALPNVSGCMCWGCRTPLIHHVQG